MQLESSERLDVLILLGHVQLRGSSKRARTLVDRLHAQKIGMSVVTTSPFPHYVELSKVQVRTSRYLNVSLIGRIARRFLATDLQGSLPDLIDIQDRSMLATGSWLARELQRPYVVTVHDYLRDRERFQIDPQWCRAVIAVSESVREELLQKTNLPEELVVVIPSGVQPVPESELTDVLTDAHSPVIGTAGPLEAGKGLRYFLRAAAIVQKDYPQALFLIAGSGPEERTLRRMAADLGISQSVTILPNLKDFDTALKAMDIFVLPAIKQGLGTIMLEAMARRLPVIATESGGVFSVVLDGTTGLLVPPTDEHALAARIRFLLENPQRARELAVAARQRVEEFFPLDKMVASTVEIYRRCARGAGKSRQASAGEKG